jgi:predicted O-linked N-acetylglucosamine transferase (SPINDLY family)
MIAGKPCRIQVNYLVYPATSGTTFHDFVVVDSIVAPPEVARFYSESRVLVATSYQL